MEFILTNLNILKHKRINTDFFDNFGVTTERKNYEFNIFPYVRYYKGLGKRLAIFGQGEVLYSTGKEEINGMETLKLNTFF